MKGHRSPCRIIPAVQCIILTFGSFGSSILSLSGTLDPYRYLVELKLKIKIIKNFTTWKWVHRKLTSLFVTFSWNRYYYKLNTFSRKRVNRTKHQIISFFKLKSIRPCCWKNNKTTKLLLSNSAIFLIFIYPHGLLVT